MDQDGFEPNDDETGADAGASWAPAPEQPTVPGLDPTEHFEPVAGAQEPPSPPAGQGPAAPQQPKWQPLPGGSWAPPAHPGYSGSYPPPPGFRPPTGYGEGQGPYGPPGYGAPPTGGYGGGGWSGYSAGGSPENGRPRWSTGRRVATGLGVAALIAAAASLGAYFGSSNSSTTPRSTASQAISSPPPVTKTSNTKIDISAIAAKVDPATVDITSILSSQDAEAEGTGMILTSDGEVLTNNHVIDGGTRITAQVDGTGRRYTVKVLGTDVTADVALVQLEGASGLPTVKIGNSAGVKVGDQVVAIGNALGLGGTPTVTSGIISALDRSITASDEGSDLSEHLSGLLQTDAPINPGNSGGPLVDAAGQVIGMDTAAETSAGTETASNIGFAIPIDTAISIAQDIQQGKGSSTILIGPKGILGVDVLSIQQAESSGGGFFGPGVTVPVGYGAYVEQVLNGSPAQSAGLSAGDVITAVNGKRVATPTALAQALSGDKPGTTVSVTWVTSSGTSHTSSITLEADPQAV